MSKNRYAVTYCEASHDDYKTVYFSDGDDAENFALHIVQMNQTYHGAALLEYEEAAPYDTKNPLAISWETLNQREVTHEGISPIL